MSNNQEKNGFSLLHTDRFAVGMADKCQPGVKPVDSSMSTIEAGGFVVGTINNGDLKCIAIWWRPVPMQP